MVILHGSDLQIGKPYRPWAAEAFVALAAEVHPDVVVVAGDLTQRAKAREYRTASMLLERLSPLPVVVTPGNHDVPLYRVWERAFAPYRNWHRFLGRPLDEVTRVAGGTVVALNSSAPRRAVVGGRLRPRQLDVARRALGGAPGARVVVTHHHFLPPRDGQGGRPLPDAPRLLAAFEDMGVDVILGGHLHQTHLYTSRDVVRGDGPGIPLVTCGTTASRRGRGPEAGQNTLNVVRVDADAVRVESYRLEEGSGFVAWGGRVFPRAGSRQTVGAPDALEAPA